MSRCCVTRGMERQYENEVIGINARIADINAAIDRVQVTKVDAWTKVRQHNATLLDAILQDPIGR